MRRAQRRFAVKLARSSSPGETRKGIVARDADYPNSRDRGRLTMGMKRVRWKVAVAVAAILVGGTIGPVGAEDVCTGAQYDRCAKWAAVTDGDGHGQDAPGDAHGAPYGSATSADVIETSPSGSVVYVVGTVDTDPALDAQKADVIVQARDAATGALRWTHSYAAADGRPTGGMSLDVTADRVFVGVREGRADLPDAAGAIVALDAASGSRVWVQPFEGHLRDTALGGDGAWIAAAGDQQVDGGSRNGLITLYETATGEPRWSHVTESTSDLPRVGTWRLAAPADVDRLVGISQLSGSSDSDTLVTVLDTSAPDPDEDEPVVLNQTRIEGGETYADRAPVGLVVRRDGSVGYAVQTISAPSGDQVLVTAVNTADGGIIWQHRHGGLGTFVVAGAGPVALSRDETRLFVTGYSWAQPAARELRTLSITARSGALSWSASHPVGSVGCACAPTVTASTASGNVLVVAPVGYTFGSNGTTFVTISYQQFVHSIIWSSVFRGGTFNNASAITTDPAGQSLYVAGSQFMTQTASAQDIVVVAYDA